VLTIQCAYCGTDVEAQRTTRKFCSTWCAQRHARGDAYPQKRACRHCGKEFEVRERADANRRHCSKQCAKNHNAKVIKAWQADNPETVKVYRANVLTKDPAHWKHHAGKQRDKILALLGGACVACGVTNPYWLHVDFIPTTRELRYRHPRHFKYVSEHLELFRILCANHHYELTLTGRIEGTDITQ